MSAIKSKTGKIALITGITGQDGSYLTELLLEKGYTVHGIVRRSSQFSRFRIEHLLSNPAIYNQSLFLHYADLTDATTLRRIINKIHPQELYHLAGQSHVGLSFEIPESTCHETAMATLSLLEICRDLPQPPRFYHASSSEIFGMATHSPQDERTPTSPSSPYGCAKAFATQIGAVYRKSYKLFICNGILYNHESPRRGENFVTRKITSTAARIKLGLQDKLKMGSLTAQRDWGHAKDYVEAMWRMLQVEEADDYIISSGKLHTVKYLAEVAFDHVGLSFAYYYEEDPRFLRPNEPVKLVGNPQKAHEKLGWQPKYSFESLVSEMVDHDLKHYQSLS